MIYVGHTANKDSQDSQAADLNLIKALDQNQRDAKRIQESIIQGNYDVARLNIQRVCGKSIIDQQRAYILDKGDSHSLPTAIVHKQSKFPFLVGNVKKSKNGLSKDCNSRYPNQGEFASECDSLLAMH